jgi:hypothetical protein
MRKSNNQGDTQTHYALILRDANGQKINGTGCPRALPSACKMAADILRLMPVAASIDIHTHVSSQHWSKTKPIETIHREGGEHHEGA